MIKLTAMNVPGKKINVIIVMMCIETVSRRVSIAIRCIDSLEK